LRRLGGSRYTSVFIFSRPAFPTRQFKFKRAIHNSTAAANQGFIVDALGAAIRASGIFPVGHLPD
jgi:hypothetical protein